MRLVRIATGMYRTPNGRITIIDRGWEHKPDGRWLIKWRTMTFPGIFEARERYTMTLRDARELIAQLS